MPDSGGDGPRYPIGSVDRVLQLLLVFRDRSELRVADVADELGVAASTAHRLLAMLQVHGFVVQEEGSRRYVPGPAILELATAVNPKVDIAELLRPATEEVRDRLGETVNAAVLRHASAVFVAGAESHHTLRIADQTGQRIPAFHSAPGKAMLADLPLARLRALYPGPRIEDPDAGVTVTRSDLEDELSRIGTAGYATNDVGNSDAAREFLSVAVPVRRNDRAVAALSVAAPAQRVTADFRERAVAELQGAAEVITTQQDW
ncbi:IclR family transcriptional regulator [Pseudonocardia sp. ICBG1122]|nr:IclR family transcriptional regulator [Pseudonocardia pini]